MDRAALWELVREKGHAESDTTLLADLDSLGVVELAMDLEDATAVELLEADMTGTVGDLLDVVVARAGKTDP